MFALACVCAFATMVPALAHAGWDPTVLPRVDSKGKLGAYARAGDRGFRTVQSGAYDGQFYWGIAVDPLARGAVHAALDKPSYRYGHPLYGWLGWLLSAGRPRAAAVALSAVGVVAFGVAAAIGVRIGRRRGGVGWEGAFVALNPGLLSAVSHDLAEPLAAAILAGALAAYLEQRRRLLWIMLAALPLAKEPLLLFVAAFVLWEAHERRFRSAGAFSTAAIPAAGWWVYLRLHLGAWFTTGSTALAAPFTGWWDTLVDSQSHPGALKDAASLALLLLLIVFAFTARNALAHPGPIAFAYLGLVVLAACLAPNATAAFTTALRNTALLLLLVPLALARPQFASGAGTSLRAAE